MRTMRIYKLTMEKWHVNDDEVSSSRHIMTFHLFKTSFASIYSVLMFSYYISYICFIGLDIFYLFVLIINRIFY